MTGVTDELADYDLRELCAALDRHGSTESVSRATCARAITVIRNHVALRTALRDAKPALEAGAEAIVWSGQHDEKDVHNAATLRALAGRIEG